MKSQCNYVSYAILLGTYKQIQDNPFAWIILWSPGGGGGGYLSRCSSSMFHNRFPDNKGYRIHTITHRSDAKVSKYSSKLICAKRANKSPSHIIGWSCVVLLVSPCGKKNENKKMILYWSKSVARLKNKCPGLGLIFRMHKYPWKRNISWT